MNRLAISANKMACRELIEELGRIRVKLIGNIEFYNSARGFGFICQPENNNKFFFHCSAINSQLRPEVGRYVRFTPGLAKRGPVALNVEIVTDQELEQIANDVEAGLRALAGAESEPEKASDGNGGR